MSSHSHQHFLARLKNAVGTDGCWVASLALVGGLAVLAMARSMGIADGEAQALDAGTAYARLLEAWATRGHAVAAITRDDLRHELGGFDRAPVFPFLLSGYAWLIGARRASGPLLDELLALRLPAVVAAASVPPLTFLLGRRTLGRPLAALAGLFTLAGPRLLVGAASLAGGATLTAGVLLWLLALDVLDRSRDAASTRGVTAGFGWSLLAGLGLGVALSCSWIAAIAVVPALARAFRGSRSPLAVASSGQAGGGEATTQGGDLLLSPLVLAALAVATILLLVATPTLLPPDPDAVLDAFQRALSPTFTSPRGIGLLPETFEPPRLHVLSALLIALPSTTLALGVLGAVVATRRRSVATTEWLLLLVLSVGVPLLAPRPLSSYPSPYSVAIPWVCLLAASGVGFLASSWRSPETSPARALRIVVAATALFAEPLVSLAGPSAWATAPAAFPFLVQAPSVETARRVEVFDAALIGHRSMASALTALCPPPGAPRGSGSPIVPVFAPSISPAVWAPLRQFHRLGCPFVPVRQLDQARLVILGEHETPPNEVLEHADALAVPGASRGRRALLRFWVVPQKK